MTLSHHSGGLLIKLGVICKSLPYIYHNFTTFRCCTRRYSSVFAIERALDKPSKQASFVERAVIYRNNHILHMSSDRDIQALEAAIAERESKIRALKSNKASKDQIKPEVVELAKLKEDLKQLQKASGPPVENGTSRNVASASGDEPKRSKSKNATKEDDDNDDDDTNKKFTLKTAKVC